MALRCVIVCEVPQMHVSHAKCVSIGRSAVEFELTRRARARRTLELSAELSHSCQFA